MSFEILNPGMLTLLQDGGRYGYHKLGLTTGGPMDRDAFHWADQLVGNEEESCQLEMTIGGLKLLAHKPSCIAITGANAPCRINGENVPQWSTLQLNSGDILDIGYARNGCRLYLAVSGGFQIAPQFGSCSTVIREGLGGLDGGPIQKGDILETLESSHQTCFRLPKEQIPKYSNWVTLRVLAGYQYDEFNSATRDLFFQSTYTVGELCDRMGYRLQGEKIHTPSKTFLSEGICFGAIQIPPDGQPIVLLNDRQTIGGYPKIGSVLSLDANLLAQLTAGGRVNFALIDQLAAEKALRFSRQRRQSTRLDVITD